MSILVDKNARLLVQGTAVLEIRKEKSAVEGGTESE